MGSPIQRSMAGALMACAAVAAQADPVTFFAEDAGTAPPPSIPSSSTAVAQYQGFLGQLATGSASTETFESFTADVNTLGQTLSVFGGAGTLLAPGTIDSNGYPISGVSDVLCDPLNPLDCPGRFNTTSGGKNYYLSSTSFTVNFGSAVSAFAFYATDLADFGGSLTVDLLDANGVAFSYDVTAQSLLSGVTGNGSLLSWGFTDTTGSYTGIRFNITQAAGKTVDEYDYIGFDDLVIGSLPGGGGGGGDVPEPASLALVASALLGLQISRRRRA